MTSTLDSVIICEFTRINAGKKLAESNRDELDLDPDLDLDVFVTVHTICHLIPIAEGGRGGVMTV